MTTDVLNKDYAMGALIEGRGVFIGTWAPADSEGRHLGQVFNLFAAPEDVPGLYKKMPFNQAAKKIAQLGHFHGHAVTMAASSATSLVTASTYKGEWFIPPRDVVTDNLLGNKLNGALATTLPARHYRSSTPSRTRANKSWVFNRLGQGTRIDRDEPIIGAVRLVRAELKLG